MLTNAPAQNLFGILIMILVIYYFFSGCIPWPCFDLLGKEDPKICQHYVHAPNDVKVEFLQDPNPKSDTVVVSWKPSYYGMMIWMHNFLSIWYFMPVSVQ